MEGRGVPVTWKDRLQQTSSLLPFLSHPFSFLCAPLTPTPSPPGAGRGGLSFLPAQRAAGPPVTQGAMGGAAPGPSPWGCLERATPTEGRAAGDGGREAARPAFLLGSRLLPLPAQPPGAPAWNMTFWTLWVETQLRGLQQGTPPPRGHLGPLLPPTGR